MLAILYLVTYIDTANIGNATIEGMLPDLKMHGAQYNIALSIYFIPCKLTALLKLSNIDLEQIFWPKFLAT